ncbi:hypothetical protein CK203_060594 [Vitis vinifera]|uniref:Uncharacterized protein n=1 Tax=Vitis vinifera TaxID=29760 RepID=A0A438FTS2_VITVI|nr:hypothetical protein CK203_060594 [Vitis vinifera]
MHVKLPCQDGDFQAMNGTLTSLSMRSLSRHWTVVSGTISNPSLIQSGCSESKDFANRPDPVHVAALAGHVKVVEKLVDELNPEDLEEKEGLLGCTPLALAASDGITEIAQS